MPSCFLLRRCRIEQGKQSHFFTLSLKLLGHLASYQPAHGPTSKQVWANRSNFADFFNVPCCHFLDLRQGSFFSIQSQRLESIERLIWAQIFCELKVTKNASADRVK